MDSLSREELSAILDAIPPDGEAFDPSTFVAMLEALPALTVTGISSAEVGIDPSPMVLALLSTVALAIDYAAACTEQTREAVIFDLRNASAD